MRFLYVQLMYVDKLDFSKVKFGKGGPPCPVNFSVSAWSYKQVMAVLAADRNNNMSYGKLQASFLSFYLCYTCVLILFRYTTLTGSFPIFLFVAANGQAFYRLQ